MPPFDISSTTYTFTMDPATPNQANRDQERTALSRTLNSLALAVQSSVFGGLGSLAHDLTLTEKRTLDSTLFASRRCPTAEAPLHGQVQQQQQQQSQPVISATFFDHQTEHQQRPWYKKKYRIIVQEISDDEDNSNLTDMTTTGRGQLITAESAVAITPSFPKSGASSSSTPAMPPGLLDWLLFTTHEDSFFRYLGRANALASQIDHRSSDVPTTANDTSALLSYVESLSPVTPETPFEAVPEPEANNSRSNIAMALATEINNSHPSTRPETHEVSVQAPREPTPVLVHKAETMDGATVVRSNGSEGHVQMIAATAAVPYKGFEDMDLQTPWWKKRQEQEGAPSWVSEKNNKAPVQESKGKIEPQPAEETLNPNLRRRSLHGVVEQPKTLETFVKTTVSTRPDGAIESKTVKVSTLLKDTQELASQDQHQHQDRRHGWWFRRHHHQDYRATMSTMVETETRVKVVHPDGSVEETVSFTRDSPSSPLPVGPPARTRREHRHHLRQQERERREQEWQAQQELRQQLQLQRQQQEEQRQQQQHEQQRHEQRQPSFESRAENATQEPTRSRIRERWARQENQVKDLDQDELSSSRTRSGSWPPKGYLRRQSSQPQPSGDQEHDDTSTSTWPPKGYLRRQEREQ